MQIEFRPGDKVELRAGGGPIMTVVDVEYHAEIKCRWLKDGAEQEASFPAATIVLRGGLHESYPEYS